MLTNDTKSAKTKDAYYLLKNNTDNFIKMIDSLMINASVFQQISMKISSEFQKAISSLKFEKLEIPNPFIKLSKIMGDINTKLIFLSEKLKRDDLFLIPYFDEVFSLGEVVGIFSNPEITAIEMYDKYFQQSENLNGLLSYWCKNNIIKDRRQILESCLNAHCRKEYVLSIPVLLAQIEGIHDEVFQYSIKKHIKKHKKVKYNIADEILGEKKFYDLVENMFRSTTKDNWHQKYPNRNIVLHGKDIKYYNKKYYSLYLILVLDYLIGIQRK